MKTTKYSFLIILMALFGMSAEAQRRNVLQVPDITTQVGNVQIPVSIENTDEIVGGQFDIILPEGITAEAKGGLANRGDGHIVTVNRLNSGAYRVLIYSPQNRPLRGQSGTVMYLPVNIPDTFDERSEHPLVISNATLGKSTGENVLTNVETGKIRIAKLPDITVKDIVCDKNEVTPGNRIAISWQVENIGELATGAGWSEQISLVAEDGSATKQIATTTYDGTLNANGIVSRQVEVTLPFLLGIHGEVRLQVRLVPDDQAGESNSAQVNNTASSSSLINISKQLSIELSPERIEENTSKRISVRLSRSGMWTLAETFSVTATEDSRVTIPSTITIPSGQSGTVMYLQMVDNDMLDSDSIVTIAAEGNGYAAVETSFVIEDNEHPDLSLKASKSVVNEGETFQLTIAVAGSASEHNKSVDVTLTSENQKRFSFPSKVTIPENEKEVTIDVKAIDDDQPSLALSNAFTASAPGYNKAEAIVVLEDDDVPALSLELTPGTVEESSGLVSVTGILRRTTNTNSKITVRLSDDSNGGLYISNRTLELAKGVEEIHFNFGPVDNAIVDGDRTYTITAAVWLSSCNCGISGENAGVVSSLLNVLDDDGPTLTLKSQAATIKEGGETTLTLTRNNTADTPLVVTLTSDSDDKLVYEHTVTIPAGQTSVNVNLVSKANDTQGDSHTAIFIAKADGYNSGTTYIMVTDQTLPDALISDITADVQESEVGTEAALTITVRNDGAAELPAEVPLKIYLRGNSTPVGTVYTTDAIGIGSTLTLTKSITLPAIVGSHSYYAVVNESNTIHELSYYNNTSADVKVQTFAPYSVTVRTDKDIYKQGEKVIISGQLTGRGIAETTIDLYLINEGVRQVKSVTTDAQGAFTYEWQLYDLYSGHFAVGACYPGEVNTTEMANFDVYGLRRSNSGYITCEVGKGETTDGNVSFINPGQLQLSGVKAEIISSPDNCEATVQMPSTISAGSTVQMNYSLKGTEVSAERKWYEVVARITSNEGVTRDVTLYFYCYNQHAQLTSDVKHLNTTITKGSQRDIPLQIVNTGKGESGNITLTLPEFMTCESGTIIPSISQNDTISVVLRIKTNDKMQLNVPVTGTIGVNCANGNGVIIDYNVEMVSEEKGLLQVDVCDEYTYYTSEAPHVTNAEVIVSHPYTGAELARGVTDNNGIFNIELPEGYYKISVSADKHEQYSNYCSINPGKTERLVVNISYNPIPITWTVGETEVEDEYEIVTTVQYETNVPKPVVKVTIPKSIDGDNMAVGDKVMINMLLTNIGLIKAEEVELDIPTNIPEWKFEALAYNEPFTLAPNQTVVVPVLITRIADESTKNASRRGNVIENAAGNMIGNYANCMAGMGSWYKNRCGLDFKTNHAAERLAMKACAYSATMQFIFDIISGGSGGGSLGTPGGGPGGGGGGGSTNYGKVTKTFDICDPCDAEMAERLINTLAGKTSLGLFDKAVTEAIKEYQSGGEGNYRFVVKKVGGDIVEKGRDAIIEHFIENGSTMVGYIVEVYELIKPCEQTTPDIKNPKPDNSRTLNPRRASKYSWQDEFKEIAETYIQQVKAMDKIMLYIYGDRIWYDELDNEKADFINYITNLEDGYKPTQEELMAHKPSSVTEEQMMVYVNHVLGDNQISTDELDKQIATYLQIYEMAVSKGFNTMDEYFHDAYESYKKKFEEMKSSSVCASITLQFKQTMTMTRQAFRGSLIVFNGHEDTPMKNAKLNLEVLNPATGQKATSHEFQINAESIDGFSGELDLTSGWTLDANATGTANVLFIPTKYAAPDEPVNWSFGGTLSYVDPFTGLEVTRELYPVTLTVKPSPELDLTYFMQRDVYGDDPMTEAVEPMKPAEFALVINNKGNGDATNVKMVTNQPEIVTNEKGLLVDFKLVSSMVNGNDAVLSFGKSIANNFGTIPAHSQMYAQWWLTSSLLGHFTDYYVEATHVTSYGNEDLSLLDEVTIHELIHGFTVSTDGDKPVRGFLVNDIADDEDQPDSLFFSDAMQQSVHTALEVSSQQKSDTEFQLVVTPSQPGWNYGNLLDPTFGKQKIVKVTRHDGKEINVDNFWQTDRTLRDSKDPLYENRLHFIGNMSADGEIFYLTFEPKPDVELEVEKYVGVPEEGSLFKEQLNEVTVKFNKPIKAESFTSDDITLSCQGESQDTSPLVIEKVNESEYKLKFNELTLLNGYYVLNVQTAGIEDIEGFAGSTGKQFAWNQLIDGRVILKVIASPVEGGSITPSSGQYDYDSDVTLKAVPADGYDFVCWKKYEVSVNDSPDYTCHLSGNTELTAVFTLKHYDVTVECDGSQGSVTSATSGIYDYGTSLKMIAVPQTDFVFRRWVINGEPVEGNSDTLTVTVDKSLNITAEFTRDIYHQSIIMKNGWNWISTYMDEPLDISDVIPYTNRIVGQYNELIIDPQYGKVGELDFLQPGKAYKVKANSAFVKTFSGHLYNTEKSPVNLKTGWNWIAYPYIESKQISDVITNATEGDCIVNQYGFAEYSDGYWEGTIDMFEPGLGYLYKSFVDKEILFEFTSEVTDDSQSKLSDRTATTEDIDVHSYPNTMNIIAKLYKDKIEQTEENFVIYALVNNELRGISQKIGSNYYLTVYGDDPVDVTFICESIDDESTYIANETLKFSDDVVGSRKNPFEFTFGTATGIGQLEYNQSPITVYSLEGVLVGRNMTHKMLKKLPKGVYIINGQKCYVK